MENITDASRYKQYYQGAYYHIYNRGSGKKDIFLEPTDYVRYLEALRKAKEKYQASVICYCLMPNHIHLLLRQDSDKPIYKVIGSLHTSYSMYFNWKYKQVGHLFEDRFKQKNIEKNEYLLYLSGYIHLNPLVDGLVKKAEDYQWSSYCDYIGLRSGTLCDKEPVLLDHSPDFYKENIESSLEHILRVQGLSLEDTP